MRPHRRDAHATEIATTETKPIWSASPRPALAGELHLRPDVDSHVNDSRGRYATILAAGIFGGAFMGGFACEAFVQVRFPRTVPTGVMFTGGTMCGFVAGLASLCYLLPLLGDTDLRRSLPLVFGVTAVVGIGLGVLHPILGGLAALIAQFTTAAVASAKFALPSGRFKSSHCAHCDYNCAGITADLCPECGHAAPDLAFRVPTCEACRQARPDATGLCPHCGAINLNHRFNDHATTPAQRPPRPANAATPLNT